MTIVRWIGRARVVRSLVLPLHEREFIPAARCVGAGRWRISANLLGDALGDLLDPRYRRHLA